MEELHAPTLPHLDLRRIRQQQQDDKTTPRNGKKLLALLDRDFFILFLTFGGCVCERAWRFLTPFTACGLGGKGRMDTGIIIIPE